MKLEEAELEESLSLGEGWIFMYHPELKDSYTKVTVDGFEEAWADQGWLRAEGLLDDDGRPKHENAERPPVEITPEEETRLLEEQKKFTGRGEVIEEDGEGNPVVETADEGGAVPTAVSGTKQSKPQKEE